MRRPDPQLSATEHGSAADGDIGDTAIFFDFENIVLGVRGTFQPDSVVEHLGSRGDVLVRRAYADWGRYSRHQSKLLELGVDMIFLPTYGIADKNRTDTAIAVDAMEILFTRPNIETFVIVSGDSDFGVLARKLRGYGKRIIGVSARSSASKVLVAVCHEFIFYESLVGEKMSGYGVADGEKLVRKALAGITSTHNVFQPSLLKDRMRKLDPSFSERNYGYSSFVKFVEAYPRLLEIVRAEGGQTRITARDGASNRSASRSRGERAPRPRQAPERSQAPRPNPTSGTPDQQATPSPRPARAPAPPAREPARRSGGKPDRAGAAKEACRKLLAVVIATFGDEEITLNKLKNRLVEKVPTFDHKKLGYPTFTAFLRDNADVVTLLQDGRRYRVRRPAAA